MLLLLFCCTLLFSCAFHAFFYVFHIVVAYRDVTPLNCALFYRAMTHRCCLQKPKKENNTAEIGRQQLGNLEHFDQHSGIVSAGCANLHVLPDFLLMAAAAFYSCNIFNFWQLPCWRVSSFVVLSICLYFYVWHECTSRRFIYLCVCVYILVYSLKQLSVPISADDQADVEIRRAAVCCALIYLFSNMILRVNKYYLMNILLLS